MVVNMVARLVSQLAARFWRTGALKGARRSHARHWVFDLVHRIRHFPFAHSLVHNTLDIDRYVRADPVQPERGAEERVERDDGAENSNSRAGSDRDDADRNGGVFDTSTDVAPQHLFRKRSPDNVDGNHGKCWHHACEYRNVSHRESRHLPCGQIEMFDALFR